MTGNLSTENARLRKELADMTADYFASHKAKMEIFDQLDEARERLRISEKEANSLAADQCEDGYAGEHGHHGCFVVERLNAALAQAQAAQAAAVAAEREACAQIALTLHESPKWDHGHQIASWYGAEVARDIRARAALSSAGAGEASDEAHS